MISFIVALIIGGVCGCIAGHIMKTNYSLLGNVILGVIGGLVGKVIFMILGIIGLSIGGWIGSIIGGVAGSCIVIYVARMIKK